MKRSALKNKRIGVWRMAFRAQKVFGTFEKRAPGPSFSKHGERELVSVTIETDRFRYFQIQNGQTAYYSSC